MSANEVARLRAEYERKCGQIVGEAFANSHIYAAIQAKSLGCPLQDEVDPRLFGKYDSEWALYAYRLNQQHGTWPTVAVLVQEFGYWERFTAKAAGQLLADDLTRAESMVELVPWDTTDAPADWQVAVKQRWMDFAVTLAAAFEHKAEALAAGHARMACGDPDPFGLNEQ